MPVYPFIVAPLVHGVAHDAEAQAKFGDWWTSSIRESAYSAIHTTPIRWGSTGSGPVDSSRILRDKTFREAAIADVRSGLRKWWLEYSEHPHKVIIAHSMGTVLASAALEGLQVPLINIGSPITHPLYGTALSLVGLGKGRAFRTLQNRDDGICALGTPLGRWARSAPGWNAEFVDVEAGPLPWPHEHPQDLYFKHPRFRQVLLEAVGFPSC